MAEVSSQREFQCLQSFFPCLFCFECLFSKQLFWSVCIYVQTSFLLPPGSGDCRGQPGEPLTCLNETVSWEAPDWKIAALFARSFFFFFLNGLFASHLFGVTVRQLTLRWFIFFSVQTPFLYLQQQMSFSALFSISLSSNQPSSHAAWKAQFSALFLGCFCFCLQL